MNNVSFTQLPAGLPIPEDDGACAHLLGKHLPDLSLSSTSGLPINLISGIIERVFYPIFPPDRHPADVVSYLKTRNAKFL